MRVHLLNFSLFDHVLKVEEPEALVYEPKNGRLRLVAVECSKDVCEDPRVS